MPQNRNARGRRAKSNSPNQNAFHPKLITSQIIAMQCLHYFLLTFLFQVNHVLYNTSITIDRIFTDKHLHLWSGSGWADICAIMISAVVGAVLLAIIVEKSKKCLDFSITLLLLHVLLCSLYDGIPSTIDWWVVHVLATIVMVVLGEYVCSKRELDDIPLLQL